MLSKPSFSKDILKIKDTEAVVNSISNKLREDIIHVLKRKGCVVGISGGIDSSVTLALAVRAMGSSRVKGIMLPEKDSSPESLKLAKLLADKFDVQYEVEDISRALEGLNCYNRRDDAVKRIFPEYNPKDFKFKIELKSNDVIKNLPPVFYATIVDVNGLEKSKRLPTGEYLQIMAASNFKQRSRMSMLYYYAEKNHYTVIGTPNKHEVKQGFFVKYGDGGADIMPIGHLYKTQVYQLATYLEVPEEIINRTPTTDTYSAEQTQEDFFFQLPFETLDLMWHAWENKYPINEVASVMGYSTKEVANIFANFKRKSKTTEYLRLQPIVYV